MSIKKVANIAGVSIATVSRFFNNPSQVSKHTSEKVQLAIAQLNYTPNTLAQNLRRGKTGLIIAVVPKISAPRYSTIIKQLNHSANSNNYSLLVKEAEFNSLPLAYYEQMIRCKQADGFILMAGLSEQDIEGVNSDLPIVVACEPIQLKNHKQPPCLSIDHSIAAQEASQHLIDLGHRVIHFLAKDPTSMTVRELKKGFQHTVQAAGLWQEDAIHYHQKTSIKETIEGILQSPVKPSALFCADDDTAIEALHWVKACGLTVPNDISIIGFNSTHYTEISDPPLTTIFQPMDKIGSHAMELLYKLIDGQHIKNCTIRFDHILHIRQSTRAI